MVKKTQKKVLIVEDEESLSLILKKRLEEEGIQVLNAENGEEGLKKGLENHPDLILLDIIMPIMDGMTMLREIRKDKWGKEVEVVVLTNLQDTEKVQEALEEKVYDYLIKTDWSLDDLIKKVKEKIKL